MGMLRVCSEASLPRQCRRRGSAGKPEQERQEGGINRRIKAEIDQAVAEKHGSRAQRSRDC